MGNIIKQTIIQDSTDNTKTASVDSGNLRVEDVSLATINSNQLTSLTDIETAVSNSDTTLTSIDTSIDSSNVTQNRNEELMKELINEIKINNLYLSYMTDIEFTYQDIDK